MRYGQCPECGTMTRRIVSLAGDSGPDRTRYHECVSGVAARIAALQTGEPVHPIDKLYMLVDDVKASLWRRGSLYDHDSWIADLLLDWAGKATRHANEDYQNFKILDNQHWGMRKVIVSLIEELVTAEVVRVLDTGEVVWTQTGESIGCDATGTVPYVDLHEAARDERGAS